MILHDTIVALATPSGMGAIAVIRISGPNAIAITEPFFVSIKGKKLSNAKTHTLLLGDWVSEGIRLDEVLVSVFKNGMSYTGEATVEISCHGSVYIQQQILQSLLKAGCRMAQPGEFTMRAFLNGKMDLTQAEAVADLIASDSEASHQVALQQMRGGFTLELKNLRSQLLDFASLIELELDFAEEDVEFANRAAFMDLVDKIIGIVKRLVDSFAIGNVLKNGIPVAIAGEPNVGKSTLLNALLNENRAIVSAIAGTTRDTVEDEITINGINYRFIDTAGIRETDDEVEKIGIEKTFEKMHQANVILYLVKADALAMNTSVFLAEFENIKKKYAAANVLMVVNKIDLLDEYQLYELQHNEDLQNQKTIWISAQNADSVTQLKDALVQMVNLGEINQDGAIVSNSRHYASLNNALEALQNVKHHFIANTSSDFIALDIRDALYHLGEITGEVTNDELLGNIFGKFCIGK